MASLLLRRPLFRVSTHLGGAVESVKSGRFPGRVNSAVYFYKLGPLLIDSGPANMRHHFHRYVAARPDIAACVLSHHHEDHHGGALVLLEAGLPVLAPPQQLDRLRAGWYTPAVQRIVWGAPAPTPGVAPWTVCADTGALQLPDVVASHHQVPKLVPVSVGGHCADHHVLHAPDEGLLFSADLYIAKRPVVAASTEDYLQIIRDLDHVATLEFDTVFCAHRGMLSMGPDAFAAKAAHLRALREECQRLYATGMSSIDVTTAVLGAEDAAAHLTSYELSKRNLVRSLLQPERAARLLELGVKRPRRTVPAARARGKQQQQQRQQP